MTPDPLPVETWSSIADALAAELTDVERRLDAGDWTGLATIEWSPPDPPPVAAPSAGEMERLRRVMNELTRVRGRVERELEAVRRLRADIDRRRHAGRAYAHASTP